MIAFQPLAPSELIMPKILIVEDDLQALSNRTQEPAFAFELVGYADAGEVVEPFAEQRGGQEAGAVLHRAVRLHHEVPAQG